MIRTNRTKFNPVTLDHPVNKKMKVEQVLITPEVARQMLAFNENNRNLRPNVVSAYARDMANGDWMPTAETIKFDWHGRLIDGQHRLHAVIEADIPVSMTVARNLDPETQAVLDMGARRTASDALVWNGVGNRSTVVAAAARLAIAYELGMFRTAASEISLKLTNSEIIRWVEEHPEIMDAVALGYRVYKNIGGTPSPMSFIAYRLMQVDEDAAVEFLLSTSEFRTDGLNDPRSTLIRTLSRLKSDRVRISAAIQISLVFRAWNAWREGRSVAKMALSTQGGAKGIKISDPI